MKRRAATEPMGKDLPPAAARTTERPGTGTMEGRPLAAAQDRDDPVTEATGREIARAVQDPDGTDNPETEPMDKDQPSATQDPDSPQDEAMKETGQQERQPLGMSNKQLKCGKQAGKAAPKLPAPEAERPQRDSRPAAGEERAMSLSKVPLTQY